VASTKCFAFMVFAPLSCQRNMGSGAGKID